MIGVAHYLTLAGVLFTLSIAGIILNRKFKRVSGPVLTIHGNHIRVA